MPSDFKDNFSKQSDAYLKFRPHYPDDLYKYLSSISPGNELAWDCGTGNGQAATGLSPYFKKVIATDPSAQQIKNAIQRENIVYMISPAESSGLERSAVDLISIANALHWFDLEKFYAEVDRVLKPSGVLAAWCYGNPVQFSHIDPIINYFHDEIIGNYWLAENRLVEKKYSTLAFPYGELDAPNFKIEKALYFADLIGLLNTWSAVQRYKDQNGSSPVDLVEKELSTAWGDKSQSKIFTWQLVLKVRRK